MQKKYLAIILMASAITTQAQIVEFSQLPSATLGAPLHVVPTGLLTSPVYPLSPFARPIPQIWGYGSTGRAPFFAGFTGVPQPYISFANYDTLGVEKDCPSLSSPVKLKTLFPRHLGSDYAAPAGTPVYAIADGTIRRVNGFTNAGDYYVVVESGNFQKWTTLYGHLNQPPSYPWLGYHKLELAIPIKKGDLIGVLYNYISYGDVPHLHLGIRQGAYNPNTANASEVAMGAVCEVDRNTLQIDRLYQANKYRFISPEQFKYYTNFY